MSTIKYNPDLTNNQFKALINAANDKITATYNRASSVKRPLGFSNGSDIISLLTFLRNCNTTLKNYVEWIEKLSTSYEDLVNSSKMDLMAMEKEEVYVRDRIVLQK